MLARQYRPDTATFLTQDRYEAANGDINLISDPLTNNRSAFAGGNPTTNIEYDGHDIASAQLVLDRGFASVKKTVKEVSESPVALQEGIASSSFRGVRNSYVTEGNIPKAVAEFLITSKIAAPFIAAKGLFGVVAEGGLADVVAGASKGLAAAKRFVLNLFGVGGGETVGAEAREGVDLLSQLPKYDGGKD